MARDDGLALVRACAESVDDDLWNRFVERFQPAIRGNVVQSLLRLQGSAPNEWVDELVQEVYCRLLEKNRRALRQCRAGSELSLKGYIGYICTNIVIDALRARSAQKRGGWKVVTDPQADLVGEHLELVADTKAGPEEELLVEESRRRFFASCKAAFVGEQRERDLEIFKLAFLEGCTSREIAERLQTGLKPGSIDSVIWRQRRLLGRLGVELPDR